MCSPFCVLLVWVGDNVSVSCSVGTPPAAAMWRCSRRRIQRACAKAIQRNSGSDSDRLRWMATTSSVPETKRAAVQMPPEPRTAPSPPVPRLLSDATFTQEEFVGMTGGQIVHEMLRRNQVCRVFGYPGGAILPVFDAIHKSPYFDFVLPRHEQGAGHMAQGYSRASGKCGVVIVTSGPGATNVITPMQDALCDGTPMVVFSGQVPGSAIGTDAFQEADIVGISRSCTKWNVLVRSISELPRRIQQAFEIAQDGRPGPVLVDLPKDITAGRLLTPAELYEPLPAMARSTLCSEHRVEASLRRIANMINKAKRPVIYAGQGVIMSGAEESLRSLSILGNIPVTTALQGLGCFDENSSRSLHMLGMHGSVYANLAIQKADVIVAIGARFDDRVTGALHKFAPEARRAEAEGRGGIIHIDILPKQIDKVVKATEFLVGDCLPFMRRLETMMEYHERREWIDQIHYWKTKHPFRYEPATGNKLKPQRVIEELYRQTADVRDRVIITTGVGQHQMWAAQFFRWTRPRSLITSGGLGTMGFGLPAAIGAKAACPNNIVVDIDGDSSFSMTAMELATAVQSNLPVKVLLLNNHFQGMVKQWQDMFYDERHSATAMKNPDFAKLAEALHCVGLRVSEEPDLSDVMAEFIDCPRPVVLDAIVVDDEHVYPMVPAGKGLDEMLVGPCKV